MKFYKFKLFFSFLVFSLALSTTLSGQTKIETSPEITILGTSNIHDWKASSNKGVVSWEIVFELGHIAQINDINVVIPVENIKSDKGTKMDIKMQEALKKETYPEIKFTLDRVEKIQSINGKGDIFTQGYLEIAGIKKLIELDLILEKINNRTIQIKLSKKLKMTDFDIKLPTALFGLIKTNDEVTIHIQFKIQISE